MSTHNNKNHIQTGVSKRMTVLMALTAVSAISMAQQITTTVNGESVIFPDTKPMMMDNRVMVPVRGVFEHMDATVEWNPAQSAVIAERGEDTVRMVVNSPTAWVNGNAITLDAPPTMMNGRVLVPLRFISESFGAEVKWNGTQRLVAITTSDVINTTDATNYERIVIDSGTVIPFALSKQLSSNNSKEGDKFTARPTDFNDYSSNIPANAVLEGHVNTAKPKEGKNPGVLGLSFDRIRLANGDTMPIEGTLIGLNNDSVEMRNGTLVAKDTAKKNNLKYVGYGAGAGALVSILGEGNLLTNALIGGALGYLIGELEKKEQQPNDVTLKENSEFGVLLTEPVTMRVPIDTTAKVKR